MYECVHWTYRDGQLVSRPGRGHPRGDGDRHHWERRRCRQLRSARRIKSEALTVELCPELPEPWLELPAFWPGSAA